MRRANASKGRPKNRGAGRKRLKQKPNKASRLPRNAPEIDLTIRFVGSRGDGIGSASYTVGHETKDWPFYVPGSLEGELVRIKPQQLTGQGLTADVRLSTIRPASCSSVGTTAQSIIPPKSNSHRSPQSLARARDPHPGVLYCGTKRLVFTEGRD